MTKAGGARAALAAMMFGDESFPLRSPRGDTRPRGRYNRTAGKAVAAMLRARAVDKRERRKRRRLDLCDRGGFRS